MMRDVALQWTLMAQLRMEPQIEWKDSAASLMKRLLPARGSVGPRPSLALHQLATSGTLPGYLNRQVRQGSDILSAIRAEIRLNELFFCFSACGEVHLF